MRDAHEKFEDEIKAMRQQQTTMRQSEANWSADSVTQLQSYLARSLDQIVHDATVAQQKWKAQQQELRATRKEEMVDEEHVATDEELRKFIREQMNRSIDDEAAMSTQHRSARRRVVPQYEEEKQHAPLISTRIRLMQTHHFGSSFSPSIAPPPTASPPTSQPSSSMWSYSPSSTSSSARSHAYSKFSSQSFRTRDGALQQQHPPFPIDSSNSNSNSSVEYTPHKHATELMKMLHESSLKVKERRTKMRWIEEEEKRTRKLEEEMMKIEEEERRKEERLKELAAVTAVAQQALLLPATSESTTAAEATDTVFLTQFSGILSATMDGDQMTPNIAESIASPPTSSTNFLPKQTSSTLRSLSTSSASLLSDHPFITAARSATPTSSLALIQVPDIIPPVRRTSISGASRNTPPRLFSLHPRVGHHSRASSRTISAYPRMMVDESDALSQWQTQHEEEERQEQIPGTEDSLFPPASTAQTEGDLDADFPMGTQMPSLPTSRPISRAAEMKESEKEAIAEDLVQEESKMETELSDPLPEPLQSSDETLVEPASAAAPTITLTQEMLDEIDLDEELKTQQRRENTEEDIAAKEESSSTTESKRSSKIVAESPVVSSHTRRSSSHSSFSSHTTSRSSSRRASQHQQQDSSSRRLSGTPAGINTLAIAAAQRSLMDDVGVILEKRMSTEKKKRRKTNGADEDIDPIELLKNVQTRIQTQQPVSGGRGKIKMDIVIEPVLVTAMIPSAVVFTPLNGLTSPLADPLPSACVYDLSSASISMASPPYKHRRRPSRVAALENIRTRTLEEEAELAKQASHAAARARRAVRSRQQAGDGDGNALGSGDFSMSTTASPSLTPSPESVDPATSASFTLSPLQTPRPRAGSIQAELAELHGGVENFDPDLDVLEEAEVLSEREEDEQQQQPQQQHKSKKKPKRGKKHRILQISNRVLSPSPPIRKSPPPTLKPPSLSRPSSRHRLLGVSSSTEHLKERITTATAAPPSAQPKKNGSHARGMSIAQEFEFVLSDEETTSEGKNESGKDEDEDDSYLEEIFRSVSGEQERKEKPSSKKTAASPFPNSAPIFTSTTTAGPPVADPNFQARVARIKHHRKQSSISFNFPSLMAVGMAGGGSAGTSTAVDHLASIPQVASVTMDAFVKNKLIASTPRDADNIPPPISPSPATSPSSVTGRAKQRALEHMNEQKRVMMQEMKQKEEEREKEVKMKANAMEKQVLSPGASLRKIGEPKVSIEVDSMIKTSASEAATNPPSRTVQFLPTPPRTPTPASSMQHLLQAINSSSLSATTATDAVAPYASKQKSKKSISSSSPGRKKKDSNSSKAKRRGKSPPRSPLSKELRDMLVGVTTSSTHDESLSNAAPGDVSRNESEQREPRLETIQAPVTTTLASLPLPPSSRRASVILPAIDKSTRASSSPSPITPNLLTTATLTNGAPSSATSTAASPQSRRTRTSLPKAFTRDTNRRSSTTASTARLQSSATNSSAHSAATQPPPPSISSDGHHDPTFNAASFAAAQALFAPAVIEMLRQEDDDSGLEEESPLGTPEQRHRSRRNTRARL